MASHRNVPRFTLILGPMFSGKSTELLRLVRRSAVAERKVLIIKYLLDTRYSETKLVTHAGEHVAEKTVSVQNIADVLDIIEDYDVIAIDEGQFFSDLRESCEHIMFMGKNIIVSALDGSYAQEIFTPIAQVIPFADSITKLNAICRYCFDDAPFTIRLVESSDLQVIGGAEIYAPVCRACMRTHGKDNA